MPKRYQGFLEPHRVSVHVDALYKLKHGLYFPPVTVEISPTGRCNQKCRYCYSYQQQSSHSLEIEFFLQIIAQLGQTGVASLRMQGVGEPLLNPATPQAIARAAKLGMKVALTTNGVLLDQQAQETCLEHLHYLKISNVDIDARGYAQEHGCPESQFGRLERNMESLAPLRQKLGADVALWATVYITGDNLSRLDAIVRRYRDIGFDFVYLTEAVFTDRCPAGNIAYASDRFAKEQIDTMQERVLALNTDDFTTYCQIPFVNRCERDFVETPDDWRDHFCKGINLRTMISEDAQVYPCYRFWGDREFSYGDLRSQSFSELWRSARRQAINERLYSTPPKGTECKVCSLVWINTSIDKALHNENMWAEFL